MSNSRLEDLQQWLQTATEQSYSDIRPTSADASFRRYFRVSGDTDGLTYIVMDAPPDKEDCRPFIHITGLIRNVNVNSPRVIAQDLELGFLLLSDLGTTPYLDQLNLAQLNHESQESDRADRLYDDALDALIKMQTITDGLPDYDSLRLLDEMALFETWFLDRHLAIHLDEKNKSALDKILALLVDNAINQPQVFVHRDYHSRNLMVLENDNPGVIDFQDAVIGPVTYDLVSLFKDCYIEWPRPKVEHWLDVYLDKSSLDISRQQLIRWFDLMGVQRHLKVLGIFCRLYYRDGKSQYLDDLPLTLKYVIDTCASYEELAPLKDLLDRLVLASPKVVTA